MTLLSIEGTLQPLAANVPTPTWLGRAAQAWFLQQVRRVDPTLADALHYGTNRRWYTVSVLATPVPLLRLTSVSDSLNHALLEKILPSLEPTITLAQVEFQLSTDYQIEQTDFETLATQAYDQPLESAKLGFTFLTPTAFHQGALAIPLPLPVLVYSSLIQAWNTFSPLPLPVSLRDFLHDSVGIARHRLATRMVQLGQREQHVGFVGKVEYTVLPQAKTPLALHEYQQRVQTLQLLTQFAPYVGIGVRTAVGMGQARPL